MVAVATVAKATIVPPETCRTAIAKYWPQNLQQTAITILVNENRHENPFAINNNSDGTFDTGCQQVNSIHKAWVDISKLTDPDYNVQTAYRIYQMQGITAFHAVKGILY